MKHRRILNAATFAAKVATDMRDPDAAELAELYDYCRARNFPPPETLARKQAEFAGQPFPFPSIDAAPEFVAAFFTTFRAVAQALEPFREDGSETEPDDEEQDDMTDPKQDPDSVEARTQAAQQAMDEAIAASGGTFERTGDATGTGASEDEGRPQPDHPEPSDGTGEPSAAGQTVRAGDEAEALEDPAPAAGGDPAQPATVQQRPDDAETRKKRK